MRAFVLGGLGVLTFLVLPVAGVCYGSYRWEERRCRLAGEEINLPTDYRWQVGCYVTLPDGRTIYINNYIINEPSEAD